MTADPVGATARARPGFESGLVALVLGDAAEGAGMLVDDEHVLTCTHVWDRVRIGDGTAEVAFLAAGGARRAAELQASRPADERHGDVALLRLRDRPPDGAAPVRLAEVGDLAGHRFEVWGFPRARAGEQLAHGVLSRRRSDDLVQLEGDTVTGLPVAPGFSGAPVWDVAHEAVVGMITSVDPDAGAKTGYLIPVDVLAELWPALPRRRAVPGPAGSPRVVGVRPSGRLLTWYDREAVRGELVDRIRREVRITQVVGRRGVGKSGVVTRAVTSPEDAGPLIASVVFLSPRTAAQDVTLSRLVHSLATLLPPGEEQRLVARFGGVGEAVLPDLFASLAPRTVVVLDNLDDLQDPRTGRLDCEDLVVFLRAVHSADAAPLVITTSQRPLGLPPDLRSALGTPIRMSDGLPPDEAVAMLRELDTDGTTGLRDLDDAVLEDLAARVDGLPRGLQVLVGYLQEHEFGGLRRLLGSDRAPSDVLAELVSVAYGLLSGTAKEVVDVLAVARIPLGCADLVELVPGASQDDVEDALADLLRRQEITRGHGEDVVRLHPLDTDHVRSALPDDRRAALHLRLADWYRGRALPQERWRQVPDADPVVQQYRHLWAAGRAAEALEVLASAAAFLSRRGAQSVLEEAVGRAAAAGLTDTVGYHACRGFAQVMAGSMDEAQRSFQAAAEAGGGKPEWVLWRGVALRHMGDAAEAVEVLRPLVEDSSVARRLRQLAGLELGLSLCYLGRVDDARGVVDLLRRLAAPGDPAEMAAFVWDVLALAEVIGGRYADALSAADAGIADYAQDAVPDSVEYVRNVRGLALLRLGRISEAVDAFTTCLAGGRQLGQDRLEGIAGVNLAWALLHSGRWEEVAAVAREAAQRLAESATVGVDGARALECAVDAADPRAALLRARDALRANPDFHRADDDEIDRLVDELAASRASRLGVRRGRPGITP